MPGAGLPGFADREYVRAENIKLPAASAIAGLRKQEMLSR